MKQNDILRFNLAKYKPQVLLTGNGLTRNNIIGWNDLISKIAVNGSNQKYFDGNDYKVPIGLLMMAVTSIDDKKRQNLCKTQFENIQYLENQYISRLLELPFDAILTTNYSYEFEAQIRKDYCKITDGSKRRYAVGDSNRFSLEIRNCFSEKRTIWHIHGELRRKSSMVVTYDDYMRLAGRIIQFNSDRKDYYYKKHEDCLCSTWVDLFLTGDIYILGQGLDFSETDLWWLINRKRREKANVGRIYYYEPLGSSVKYKHFLLQDCGVQVKDLGISIKDDMSKNEIDAAYNGFYIKAINDINAVITKVTKGDQL